MEHVLRPQISIRPKRKCLRDQVVQGLVLTGRQTTAEAGDDEEEATVQSAGSQDHEHGIPAAMVRA